MHFNVIVLMTEKKCEKNAGVVHVESGTKFCVLHGGSYRRDIQMFKGP